MIPAELRERSQWVVWRFEERDGKRTKVPYQASGRRAEADNPDTWTGFEEARSAAERSAVGVGYVFAPDDPYAGVDLDDCLEGDVLHPDAAALVSFLDSYTERSPSGTGVKVFVRASKNGITRCRTSKTRWGGEIEIYDSERFFCVTGDHLRGCPTAIEERQDELRALLKAAFPEPDHLDQSRPTPQPVELEDEEVLQRATTARNGADFDRLWSGDIAGYPSRSEADLALCGALAFWTGGDPARIDRMFRRSGLMREKWDSRRGESTYGAQTVEKAIAGRTEFYGSRLDAENPFPRDGNGVERVAPAERVVPVPVVVRPPLGGPTVGRGNRPAVPDSGEGVGGPVFEVVTARGLCELPDPPQTDELLGSLVVRGQRIVIGAHTGEGKTTIALQLVRAIVAGADFLDWKGAAGCRALVIDAEQGLKTIKRRLREVGLDSSDDVDYVRVPDGLELDRDEAQISALERLLEEGRYALVLVDPLYKLHGGNSNDEREAVNLMRRFDRWRERFGFALPLPVHLRKPIPGEKFSIHDVFGSSAYVRGAEVVLGLRRVSNGFAELHFFKDRDGDLPVGDKWGLLFDRDSGFRRAPDEVESEEEIAERLLAFVRENPGQSTTKVTDAVEGRKATLTRILRNDDKFRSERKGQADLWFEADAVLLAVPELA